ncbi:MAG: helix-turn-helix transcriptional regulator [Pseudomonadota bacterium]
MNKYDPDSIRRLRRHLGLTKREFGEKIGMTKQYVHSLELGLRRPNVRTLEKIMAAYQVEAQIFFGPCPASAQEHDNRAGKSNPPRPNQNHCHRLEAVKATN